MWSKPGKQTRLLLLLCAALLVVLGAVLAVSFLIPFHGAKNTMDPEGLLHVLSREDGSLQLQWPEGSNAGAYSVQILDADGKELYACTSSVCKAELPQLPEDRELTVRITSVRAYGGKIRKGSKALEAKILLPMPQIHDLTWQPDDRFDTVDVSFDMSEGDLCSVYLSVDGAAPVLLEQVHEGKVQLRFGVDDRFPVPEYGQRYEVSFRLERSTGNVAYHSAANVGFALTREHFLGTDIRLEQVYNGNNSYTFAWNEARGEYYDVRVSEDGGTTWMTLAYIPASRERVFTTPALTPHTDYLVSVVAVGGETVAEGEFAAQSPVLQLYTQENLLYSTIWPLKDLTVYADAEATEELGTAAAASAWCVLGEEGRYLKIRFEGQDGYIDGEYCMINLPEYLGNLCAYDITNSYSSIYLVHEYGIADVSGTVILGYEDVQVAEGEYLVPLLYPVAQKLLRAGLSAKEQGYRLKIYDSFRPQQATDDIFWRTRTILGRAIPAQTYSGKKVTDLYLVNWGPAEGEENTSGVEYGALSYRRLMTNNGAYGLDSFLASGTSRHNFGVALDLTLEDARGNELPMQTSMHDLSWYSASARNNANAELLRSIMNGAGFGGIASEWWHYQDNEIMFRNAYPPLKTGVSAECWVADHNGWRYRLANGSFYANCTQTIGEESYSFDENGYLIQGF